MNQAVYEYEALTPAGARRRGVAQAISQAHAYRGLIAQGLAPVWIRPHAERRGGAGRRRLRASELAGFTSQLSVLLASRVPLTEALAGIGEQERQGAVKTLAGDLARRVQSGESLASALDAHRAGVGDVYVETVAAAERSGNLIGALEQMCESIERGDEMTRAVRGALMYPACVVGVLALATTFLVGFVVPKFAAMFARRGADLPWVTWALGEVGMSLQTWWWAYLIGGVAGAVLGWRWWQTAPGRRAIEGLLHRVPVVRSLLIGLAVARFSRILGMSLSSGLRIAESLELAGRASGRAGMRAESERLATQVQGGDSLADGLSQCRYLTPMARRLISAGEKAGEMARMCGVVARYYDRQVLGTAKNMATVIEPVLIVLIAGVVLVIALAIFLPMWDMLRLVG